MAHASRTPSKDTQPNRGLAGALFGAAATFIVLTGAVAIADTPRQLSSITESLVSAEVFQILPPSWSEARPAEEQALPPATGVYNDSGLQVTYDVFA